MQVGGVWGSALKGKDARIGVPRQSGNRRFSRQRRAYENGTEGQGGKAGSPVGSLCHSCGSGDCGSECPNVTPGD